MVKIQMYLDRYHKCFFFLKKNIVRDIIIIKQIYRFKKACEIGDSPYLYLNHWHK